MIEIDVARHSRLIDPRLHVWGWEVAAYLFLGGMAAGAMIVSSLLASRRGERSPASRWLGFAAPALLSLGMLALFLDLAWKAHVYRFYVAFRLTSPMSWGAWILLLVYPASLLAALGGLDDREARAVGAWLRPLRLEGLAAAARDLAVRRAAGVRRANVAVGVALGVYTGILLSTLGARALWSSALLGPLFLASGLSTGAALFLLFPLSAEEHGHVARWDRTALALEMALLGLVLVGLATGGEDAKAAAGLLLGGHYTAPFWALVVIAGLAVPLLLETVESRLRLGAGVVAPALVLAGGLALRWILLAAGQA